MTAPVTATLLVSCRDRTGLVAALSDFVFRHGNGSDQLRKFVHYLCIELRFEGVLLISCKVLHISEGKALPNQALRLATPVAQALPPRPGTLIV